jgi:hypothetical protein
MNTPASREHDWLQRLVGDWVVESQSAVGADDKPQGSIGTESVRALGELWILADGEGEIGGTTVSWQMTLGYDSERQLFVGAWIGSMMEHLFTYEGQLDGDRLILETSGPDMQGQGRDTRYRDVIEIEAEDRRTLTSQVLEDDGEWREFMRTVLRRAS